MDIFLPYVALLFCVYFISALNDDELFVKNTFF